jgi:hypothetical protein
VEIRDGGLGEAAKFQGDKVSEFQSETLIPWHSRKFALITARNGMAFRFKEALNSAHAEAEDRKLRKELALEVLALKVPFRNLLLFPNQAPWPGRLEGLNPSHNT